MASSILMVLLSKNLFASSAVLKMIPLALFSTLNILMAKKHRGCTKYVIISSDYRSSINRNSLYFKSVYRLRIESERYNSRSKALDFEKGYVRNINSVSNLNIFSHFTLLTIAIVAIKLGKFDKFKSLVGLMQSA
jgi:hypothetical protein